MRKKNRTQEEINNDYSIQVAKLGHIIYQSVMCHPEFVIIQAKLNLLSKEMTKLNQSEGNEVK